MPVKNVTSQTDKFAIPGKNNNFSDPLDNKFVTTKTGRDQACQVDVTKLCNFDFEVIPIIKIILTKTLEQALWEVENEAIIEAMNRKKKSYFEENEKNTKNQLSLFLEREIDFVNEKYDRIAKVSDDKQRIEKVENDLRKVEKPVELVLPSLAQVCISEFKNKQNCVLEIPEIKEFGDWLIKKSEEFLLEDYNLETEIAKILNRIEFDVRGKIQESCDLKISGKWFVGIFDCFRS